MLYKTGVEYTGLHLFSLQKELVQRVLRPRHFKENPGSQTGKGAERRARQRRSPLRLPYRPG